MTRVTILVALFFNASLMANISRECKSTSASECRDKSIGDGCKNGGQCLVQEWSFDEPVCQCYQRPDMKKSLCQWTSDVKCRDRLPGGRCIIARLTFDEPSCTYVDEHSTRPGEAQPCTGFNVHGDFPKGGGCNIHGCWPAGGECNIHGCSTYGKCTISECPGKVSYKCKK